MAYPWKVVNQLFLLPPTSLPFGLQWTLCLTSLPWKETSLIPNLFITLNNATRDKWWIEKRKKKKKSMKVLQIAHKPLVNPWTPWCYVLVNIPSSPSLDSSWCEGTWDVNILGLCLCTKDPQVVVTSPTGLVLDFAFT